MRAAETLLAEQPPPLLQSLCQEQHFAEAGEAATIKARINVNAGSLPMPRYTLFEPETCK